MNALQQFVKEVSMDNGIGYDEMLERDIRDNLSAYDTAIVVTNLRQLTDEEMTTLATGEAEDQEKIYQDNPGLRLLQDVLAEVF